ncbi:IS630 transposase-related protein [Rickettsia endosymbiont of Gonocerus acuteangulatus]|uniref:IS630 transposase-related protein n=1 Tax=Rickettsia endosymbiont of Gonocerus acuteangulatus TaxID=3066266 RepID=UPI003132FDC8
MARAYAIELRLRVIKAVEAGIRISKVSKLFNVSRDTIYKWKKLKDKQGTLEAATGYQKGHSHKIKDSESFNVIAKIKGTSKLHEKGTREVGVT